MFYLTFKLKNDFIWELNKIKHTISFHVALNKNYSHELHKILIPFEALAPYKLLKTILYILPFRQGRSQFQRYFYNISQTSTFCLEKIKFAQVQNTEK